MIKLSLGLGEEAPTQSPSWWPGGLLACQCPSQLASDNHDPPAADTVPGRWHNLKQSLAPGLGGGRDAAGLGEPAASPSRVT